MRAKIQFFLFFFLCVFCIQATSKEREQPPAKKLRVLVGSPIRQKPAILKEFLESLDRLEKNSYAMDYFFVDDNDIEASRVILQDFAKKKGDSCSIYFIEQDANSQKFICERIHYRCGHHR